MHYHCTRDSQQTVSAAQAIAQGISENGGLFVPESFPQYTHADLEVMAGCTYQERAVKILGDFLTDFSKEEIEDCVAQAYAPEKFSGGNPAPLSLIQNGAVHMYLLELWHGPTCAFKDMALQLLPHLLTRSVSKTGSGKTSVILVATSGDTGKAALEGFKDVAGTRILTFYPENGVSPMQKRQMCTQEGGNVGVCAIEGNFDDAQTGVKRIFTDPAMRDRLASHNMAFSSANSINWGRLLPQIVYYFSAYCDLIRTGEIDYAGEQVNVVVPTGNFGNILAAYYARKMGLPVKRLICASNSNNVLTDFLRTGVYDRNRPFYTTMSPSMDILVSSNLERLLYDMTGCDDAKVSGWMRELSETGRYQVDGDLLEKLRALFYAGYCGEEDTLRTIRELYRTENYLCDPHTAVAVDVYRQYVKETGDSATPSIVASTASPYKFADSVLRAVSDGPAAGESEFDKVAELSALTGTQIPAPIAALQDKAVRFEDSCAPQEMDRAVLRLLGIG